MHDSNLFTIGTMQVHAKHCESLPLHLAARYGCPMNVIQMLVRAYPRGLNEKNRNGETPFKSTYTNKVCSLGFLINNLVHAIQINSLELP